MRRAVALVWLVCLGAAPAVGQGPFPPPTPADRIVVVAPHPDDEVIGTGGLIQQACATGAAVRVVYLTSGDHNQIAFKLYKLRLHLRPRQYLAFGELREREAIAATGLLGLSREQLTFLGYPDWGTLRMWRDYWGECPPFRSDATQATAVPYRDAFGFEHPYKPESVVADLEEVFREFRPTKVFVTHPADTNPDHRSAANFVRLAVLQLGGVQTAPQIYYYVVHFGSWPRPYHYHPELALEPPRQLLDDGVWRSLPLTPEQTQRKYEAILQNRTQLTVSEYSLVSFARANEIFATIDVPVIPAAPVNTVINWKQAIRNKVVKFTPAEVLPAPDAERSEVEPVSLELEETAFIRQGDELIAQVTLRNRLGKRANVHLFLYAYKRGEDFDRRPKLQVNITPLGRVHVFDGGQRLTNESVTVVSVENRLIVRVPLRLLGEPRPDLLFTATRANLGEVAADDTAWRLFSLSNGLGNRHNPAE
ncbi:MAG TPA: PIG-L family deacetylase [Verrucomicrobiae bacterium]|nr:PIG-L family deacetylase [Verrucomicrobiae bacterium]